MTFAEKYGPWALVAGASDGVGAAFAEGLAGRGVNVALVARRQAVLDDVAAGIRSRTGAQTRTLAVDLAEHEATSIIAAATDDLRASVLRAKLADAQEGHDLFHGHVAYNAFAAPMNCQIYPERPFWKQDIELAPGVTKEEIRAKTEADYAVSPKLVQN